MFFVLENFSHRSWEKEVALMGIASDGNQVSPLNHHKAKGKIFFLTPQDHGKEKTVNEELVQK